MRRIDIVMCGTNYYSQKPSMSDMASKEIHLDCNQPQMEFIYINLNNMCPNRVVLHQIGEK